MVDKRADNPQTQKAETTTPTTDRPSAGVLDRESADADTGGRTVAGREKFDADSKPEGKVDPRTGEAFEEKSDGLKGLSGADESADSKLPAPPVDAADLVGSGTVPSVDPDRIPAEVTPGVTPDPHGDRLLAAAQAKAPSLTREFVDAYKLTDEDLGKIARGEVPPPPTPGPLHSADLYLTPGGWQQTPPDVAPEDVGKNAVGRG